MQEVLFLLPIEVHLILKICLDPHVFCSGFWDEASLQKSPNKPSAVSKSNSTSAVNTNKQVIKQNKSKTRKEEQQVMKLFSNGPASDEFTEWCTNALKKLNSTVDSKDKFFLLEALLVIYFSCSSYIYKFLT